MPHVDKRSGEIVVRVVYDGPAEAGKSTNIIELCEIISLQRRGKRKSPGSKGPRTEFFDWLDFAGGFVDGRRVRCQLVSVPGQSALLRRRSYLLKSADAVVFVADSRPGEIGANRHAFGLMEKLVVAHAGRVPVGIILQANKQDYPGALAPLELGRGMELRNSIPVFRAQANIADGVMPTFMMAVRLATDRVRELILLGALPDMDADTPESLYEAMLSDDSTRVWADPPPQTEILIQEAAVQETGTAVADAPEKDAAEANAALPTPSGTPAPAAPQAAPAPAPRARPRILRVPSANDVPAGHLWPPVNGRSVLAAVNEAAARPVEGSASWAPADSVEFRTNNGWILHTREAWLFSEQGTGREHLMRTIKRCLPAANFVPEGRALLLAPDENHWRLWMISPITPTLRQIIDSALGVNEVKTVSAALRDTALAAEVLAGAEAPAGVFLSPVLDSVSVANGRVVSFTLPGDAGAGSANEAPDVIEELKTVLLPAAGNQAAVGQCLRQAIRLVDSEPIRKLVTSIIEPILLADRAS